MRTFVMGTGWWSLVLEVVLGIWLVWTSLIPRVASVY